MNIKESTSARRRSVPLWAKALQVLAVMLLLAILAIQVHTFWSATIDDAFISFRYSVHWAQGHGLTFNVGERVEGYSNFLWVAFLAAASKAGLDVVVVAKVVGLLSLLAVAVFSIRALAAGGQAQFAAVVGLLFIILSNTAYVFLAVGGLETIFFAALIMLLLDRLRLSNNRLTFGSALLLVLLALTRPEGIIFSVALLPTLWWLGRGQNRRLLLPWLVVVVAYGVFLYWRWRYFGALLPNTFYAKPSAATVFGPLGALANAWLVVPELGRFLATAGGTIAAVFALRASTHHATRRQFMPASAVIVAGLAFQVYAGPDWMNLGRFLLPVWVPFVVLVLAGWQEVSQRLGKRWQVAGLALWVGLTAILNLGAGSQFWSEREKYPNFVLTSEDMIVASQWIDAHYPEHYSIVCWRIGAIGYYTDLTIIDDRWGLTDVYIARLRHGNRLTDSALEEYRAKRSPELFIEQALGNTPPPDEMTIGGRRYLFVRRFPLGSDEWWDLYQRADLPVPSIE